MAKYYIADMHFHSKGVINFDDRPFENLEEMHKVMIERYNSVVGKSDDIYILGDIFLGGTTDENEEVLSQLKGQKHLIVGNHDRKIVKGRLKKYFNSISDYKVVDDYVNGFTKKVVLCHYPIPVFNGHFREDYYHFYGHVHRTVEENLTFLAMVLNKYTRRDIGNMLNVGTMMPYMDYYPRDFSYLAKEVEVQNKIREEFYKKHEQEILHLINETYNKKVVK